MTTDNRPEPELFLDDHRGVYIPRDFAEAIDPRYWFGITTEEIGILADPDHDLYWDLWSNVCDNAIAFLPEPGQHFGAGETATMDAAHVADAAGQIAERDRLLATLPGQRWSLYQEDALWLIPDGMEQSDEGEWSWPDDTAE